jgi:hypothetical protein
VNCLSENQAVIQPLVTLVDINKRDVIPIAGFILDNYFHAYKQKTGASSFHTTRVKVQYL